ncbi:hypothetical protein [Kitasatospora albolonga]
MPAAAALTGRTGSLWIALAEMATPTDQANCAYYEVCRPGRQVRPPS